MFVIVRNDNWVWNHQRSAFEANVEIGATYVDAYRARKVAVRVGSLQGSTGEPLTVLPLGEWNNRRLPS